MTQPEKVIENEILDWLNSIEFCFAWKYHVGGKRGQIRTRGNKYTPNGMPDIMGLYKGVFFAIEVKQGKGKPNEEQLAKIEKILGCRGVAFWCNSLEKAQACFYFHFNVEDRTEYRIIGERPIFED